MADEFRAILEGELESIKSLGRYRFLRDIGTPARVEITIGGKKYLNFSSNDYLGFATSDQLIDSLGAIGEKWGIGSGASRLICGNMEVHGDLERRIAAFKGTESGLVFSSGYMANLGIVSTLGTPGRRSSPTSSTMHP